MMGWRVVNVAVATLPAGVYGVTVTEYVHPGRSPVIVCVCCCCCETGTKIEHLSIGEDQEIMT